MILLVVNKISNLLGKKSTETTTTSTTKAICDKNGVLFLCRGKTLGFMKQSDVVAYKQSFSTFEFLKVCVWNISFLK